MTSTDDLRAYLANQSPEDAAANAHWLDDAPVLKPAGVWANLDANDNPVYLNVTLYGEQSKSWNTYYAGVHHTKRSKEAKRAHGLVVAKLAGCGVQFTSQVDIKVAVYRGNLRRFDSDNVVDKFYIDGLVQAGVLIDDSYQYVRWAASAIFIDKDNPRVVIEVTTV